MLHLLLHSAEMASESNLASYLPKLKQSMEQNMQFPQPAIDPCVWPGFENFNHVQAILDQNRILINEMNQNHESRNPEALLRNVALIQELNANIAKVVIRI